MLLPPWIIAELERKRRERERERSEQPCLEVDLPRPPRERPPCETPPPESPRPITIEF